MVLEFADEEVKNWWSVGVWLCLWSWEWANTPWLV